MPPALSGGIPQNLIASGTVLEKLRHLHPERLASLREGVEAGQAEVCGGCYLEREDALLPVESGQVDYLHFRLLMAQPQDWQRSSPCSMVPQASAGSNCT